MIFDVLNRKIKDMKDLRRLEVIKANQVQQLATDAKYHALVGQVKGLSEAIRYVRDNLGFPVPDSLHSDLLTLLANLKSATSTGYADKDAVTKAETYFKSIQTAAKKEWGKYFSAYTATTLNTLRVISGIDAEKINGCIAEIKAAEVWSVDITVFAALKTAIESAENLIQSLGMDQETVSFLTKMTSGKATMADLSERVLSWIRKEGLESKIKLSFLSK